MKSSVAIKALLLRRKRMRSRTVTFAEIKRAATKAGWASPSQFAQHLVRTGWVERKTRGIYAWRKSS